MGQITRSFVKFGCSTGIFLTSANLICRSTDISKCFRGSLRLRDNMRRLYMHKKETFLNCLIDTYIKLDLGGFLEPKDHEDMTLKPKALPSVFFV